jgi:hypothetical protein
MPAKDKPDASDWIGVNARSPGTSSPARTIASIKRLGWKPVLTGNRSLSSLQLGVSALGPLLPRITKSDRKLVRLRIGRVPLRPRSLPRIESFVIPVVCP